MTVIIVYLKDIFEKDYLYLNSLKEYKVNNIYNIVIVLCKLLKLL